MRRAAGAIATAATILLAGLALAALAVDPLAAALPPLAAGLAVLAIVAAARRRWGLVLLAAAGLIAAGSRIVPELRRTIPAARAGDGPPLTVLTWNVWFTNPAPADTAAAIVRSGADVVLLQETTGTFADALPLLDAAYPYRSRCRRRCGLTILSKRPLTGDRYKLRRPDGTAYGPPLQWATTTAPDGLPVTLWTLHYPHRNLRPLQDGFASALRSVDTAGLIVAGDMNLTPWSRLMARQDAAWRPLVRMTRGTPSWRAVLGGHATPPLFAIDQLYAGPAWRRVGVRALPAAGSDHAGLLVTLRRAPA